MKKYIFRYNRAPAKNIKKLFLLLLFLAGASLFAQTLREIKIYIPPVLGEGNHGDGIFFYNQLTYEVIFQHHLISRLQQGSDYTLRGIISQEAAGHLFQLIMMNSATDEVVAQQDISYSRVDRTVESFLSTIVFNMLSGMPNVEETDVWNNKWIFLSACVLWTPRLYQSHYDSISWHNIGLGFEAEVYFLKFMSFSAGVQFSQDWIVISASPENMEFRDLILEIPIAVKFVFRPFGHFMLEPYGGVSLNISLMEATAPSLLSWFAGFQFGVRAGPGAFIIDPRFCMDFFNSFVDQNNYEYKRNTIQIGMGYKFGFFSKR